MSNYEIYSVNGPVVKVTGGKGLAMMDMVYAGDDRLIGEVVGVSGSLTTVQVYEDTTGLAPGQKVEPTHAPMSLLLTGFGLRDTIMDVANIQFEEVLKYDIEVYFSGHQNEDMQNAFREGLADAKQVGFFHQSSVELNYGGRTWDLSMIAAEDSIAEFIDFHSGEEKLNLIMISDAIPAGAKLC